jgi:hypothetical protein
MPDPTPPSVPSAGGFDVNGARQAGYSDDEILDHLTQTRKFDVSGAASAGYSKPEIIDHLSSTSPPTAPTAPTATQSSPFTRFTKSLVNQLNPIEGIKGLAQLTAHPIDTYQADAAARSGIWNDATKRIRGGDIPGGIAKGVEAFMPFLGPSLSQAGDQFQSGDVAGGAGSSVGMGLAMAGPSKLGDIPLPGRGILQSGARGLYQGALKPSAKSIVQRGRIVDTGLIEGLPADPQGITNRTAGLADSGQQISQITKGAPQTQSMSPGIVVSELAKLKQPRLGVDVAAIDAVENEFLDRLRNGPNQAVRNMTPGEAQGMKTEAQQAATRLKKAAYEPGGQPNAGKVEGYQTVANTLGDQLVGQFPELAAPYARYAALKEIGPSLEAAVKRSGNRNPFGALSVLSGVTAGTLTGNVPHGILAGAMVEALSNPAIRSRLAIAMSRASKGSLTIPAAAARVVGYSNALGQAVGPESSGQPGDRATQ